MYQPQRSLAVPLSHNLLMAVLPHEAAQPFSSPLVLLTCCLEPATHVWARWFC